MSVKEAVFDSATNLYIFDCPHCSIPIEVEKNGVCCGIFRHGYFFNNIGNRTVLTHQVPPHASKEMCDTFLRDGKVYGCCGPFRMRVEGEKILVEICDYI